MITMPRERVADIYFAWTPEVAAELRQRGSEPFFTIRENESAVLEHDASGQHVAGSAPDAVTKIAARGL